MCHTSVATELPAEPLTWDSCSSVSCSIAPSPSVLYRRYSPSIDPRIWRIRLQGQPDTRMRPVILQARSRLGADPGAPSGVPTSAQLILLIGDLYPPSTPGSILPQRRTAPSHQWSVEDRDGLHLDQKPRIRERRHTHPGRGRN